MEWSPWLVYLILQLDDIRAFLWVMLAILIFGIVFFGSVSDVTVDTQIERRYEMITIVLAVSSIACMFLVCVTPSTKSAAIITCLPGIVNDETLPGEPVDLYNLAKKGLEELVVDDETPIESED